MAAAYPNSIYSPEEKENKSGVVYNADKKTISFAEDFNVPNTEIVAIETELGTDPKGDYEDVKTRLEAIEAGMLNPSKEYFDILNWCGAEGLIEIHVDGSYTLKHRLVLIESGAIIWDLTEIGFNDFFVPDFFADNKPFTIEFLLLNLNSIDDIIHYLAIGDPWSGHDYFGFILDDGGVLYAGSGSNLDEERTNTGVILAAGEQITRLRAVFTKGTDVKFYVNDILKATHTDELPGTIALGIRMSAGNMIAANKTLEIGRILIKKEY